MRFSPIANRAVCGSVRGSGIVSLAVRFGLVIYLAVRFGAGLETGSCTVRPGAVSRYCIPYGAVRSCDLSYGVVRYGFQVVV